MKTITEFVNSPFNKSKTHDAHKSRLDKYFKVINKKPDNYFNKNKTDDDYTDDIETFYGEMKNNNYTNLTIKSYLATIKVFFKKNKVENLDDIFHDAKRTLAGVKPTIMDDAPTRQQLKQILYHADILENALYLTLASSGMRINECLCILESDIDINHKPAMITLKEAYTKAKSPCRTVFISNEARDSIKEWLKVKQEWIDNAIDRYRYAKNKDKNDLRVFPISKPVAERRWIKLLEKSKLDKTVEHKTKNNPRKHYVYHLHTLRKFFRTNMPKGDISIDMVEQLMGHTGYLTREYRKYSNDELGKEYQKSMHSISIFEKPIDVETLEEQKKTIDTLKGQIKEHEKLLKTLDNNALIKLISTLDIDSDTVKAFIEEYLKRKPKTDGEKMVMFLNWIAIQEQKEKKE